MASKLRRTAALALAAGAVLAASPAAAGARAACTRPDAQRLARWLDPLPGAPTHVRIQLSPLPGAPRLRWAAVSWEAPPDGAVVILDCAGRPLASEPVGPILRIRPGPAIAGRPTLEAIYRRNDPGNVEARSVVLLRYVDPSLAVVWRHDTSDISQDPSKPGRGVALSWRWRFSPNGRLIRVTGERAVGALDDLRRGSVAGVPGRLRPQAFCWIPGRGRFDRCAP